MQGPNSSDELLELFGDIKSSGYINPTFLNDTKVGFSIQKNILQISAISLQKSQG